ncbi:MAG: hypothetical protein [Malazfec virus 3]
MYPRKTLSRTQLTGNPTIEGETIEQKLERKRHNKEVITDGAPIIYTERKDGVQKAYDIRADRWEIAIEAKDRMTRENIAKREASMKVVKDDVAIDNNDGKTDSI